MRPVPDTGGVMCGVEGGALGVFAGAGRGGTGAFAVAVAAACTDGSSTGRNGLSVLSFMKNKLKVLGGHRVFFSLSTTVQLLLHSTL